MASPVRPRQLPLDLAHAAGHTRDDLVVARSNEAAMSLIDSWPEWPSSVVVLAGPPGSGKSHLASIWCEEAGAVPVSRNALDSSANEAARRAPILIDDVDGEPIDEKGLFHLINTVRQHGGHLLLTARRFPMAWGVRLPDLESRLKAAATVEIHEPDDMLLAAVVTKLFADRQVEVEPHVVQFIVRRIERSLSTAIDVVARIDRAALEQKSRITRSLAASVVSAVEMGQGELPL